MSPGCAQVWGGVIYRKCYSRGGVLFSLCCTVRVARAAGYCCSWINPGCDRVRVLHRVVQQQLQQQHETCKCCTYKVQDHQTWSGIHSTRLQQTAGSSHNEIDCADIHFPRMITLHCRSMTELAGSPNRHPEPAATACQAK